MTKFTPKKPNLKKLRAHVKRVRAGAVKPGVQPIPVPADVKPGDMTAEGIFICRHEVRDKAGGHLLRTFNVFAAPVDLLQFTTYQSAQERVVQLKNWHGHDGEVCTDEQMLNMLLANGNYGGGWVIPPLPFLQLMYVLRDKGYFKHTFNMRARQANIVYDSYWSSTEVFAGEKVHTVSFGSGADEVCSVSEVAFRGCRPIRFVAAVKP